MRTDRGWTFKTKFSNEKKKKTGQKTRKRETRTELLVKREIKHAMSRLTEKKQKLTKEDK
jgi:hypothetical protein